MLRPFSRGEFALELQQSIVARSTLECSRDSDAASPRSWIERFGRNLVSTAHRAVAGHCWEVGRGLFDRLHRQNG